jgi:hypothetical protein
VTHAAGAILVWNPLSVGLTAPVGRQRRLRYKICLEQGNLSHYITEQAISETEANFLVLLQMSICGTRKSIQSEVIQCLAELRNGLSLQGATSVGDILAYLVSNGLSRSSDRERGTLTLLPPKKQLRRKDAGLYRRSHVLYERVKKLVKQSRFRKSEARKGFAKRK